MLFTLQNKMQDEMKGLHDKVDNFKVPEQETYDNAFKIQWELFLRHVVLDEPFRWNLLEGAKGVQLAEMGLKSSEERRWIELPELEA